MGQQQTYHCNTCTYSTVVAGARDITMMAVTDPYICTDCNELVDVLIGEQGFVFPLEIRKEKPIFYTCPNCSSSSHLVKWKLRKRPCPKCLTGKMEIDSNGEVWMTD